MNKIAKDELREAVDHKLRFSFDLPKFDEEERERIVTKMAAFWPDFYDGTKATIGSMVVTGILIIFGAMKYHGENSWIISGIVYAMSCFVVFGVIVMIFANDYHKAKDKDICNMRDVARWAIRSKTSMVTLISNIIYIAIGIELFALHYWFVATSLFIALGAGLWIRKKHNEEIVNRLSKLAKVGKDELG